MYTTLSIYVELQVHSDSMERRTLFGLLVLLHLLRKRRLKLESSNQKEVSEHVDQMCLLITLRRLTRPVN